MYTIIGAAGFLGSYLIKEILEKTQDDIFAVYRKGSIAFCDERIKAYQCDLSDYNSVSELCRCIDSLGKQKIIYLAAYHNIDLVAKNPRIAENINISALDYFYDGIDSRHSLFFASSDTVYGEGFLENKFSEVDTLRPINLYGEQKKKGEELTLNAGYSVFRLPFLIAPSLSSYKKHFYDKILDSLLLGNPFELFTDSVRSSLDYETVARLLIQLIEQSLFCRKEVINIAGDKALSKYDIGLLIAQKNALSMELIIPTISEKAEVFHERRAKVVLMDNSKLKRLLNIPKVDISI